MNRVERKNNFFRILLIHTIVSSFQHLRLFQSQRPAVFLMFHVPTQSAGRVFDTKMRQKNQNSQKLIIFSKCFNINHFRRNLVFGFKPLTFFSNEISLISNQTSLIKK